MSETITRPATTEPQSAAAPRLLPTRSSHAAQTAQAREQDGWLVPATYGDARAEYDAVRGSESAGVIDLSHRGRIEVTGTEAVMFLNGMVTNDVAKLEAGTWMPLAFPNVQGRLVAFARVFKTDAGTFLFDTEAATRAAVLKLLGRFTLAGDFRVADRTDDLACLSVQGARAGETLARALGAEAAAVAPHRIAAALDRDGSTLHVARATHTGEDGYDIFIDANRAAAFFDELAANGARPIGADALDVLRVEAGVPRHAVDVTEQNVVLEAGQEDAVSFTKGCYAGQEIIARIHWRGHVAKRLAGVEFDAETNLAAGGALVDAEGKPAGTITSPVRSPARGSMIALAMIRYAHLAPGTELRLADDPAVVVRVAELPFVRGSWRAAADSQTPPQEPTR